MVRAIQLQALLVYRLDCPAGVLMHLYVGCGRQWSCCLIDAHGRLLGLLHHEMNAVAIFYHLWIPKTMIATVFGVLLL